MCQDREQNKKKGRASRGVAFYIRNDIADLQYTDGISDTLGLYVKTKKLLIINLYKQPDDKPGSHRLMDVEFRNALGIIKATLTSIKSPTPDIIITEDFNLPHTVWPSGDMWIGATSDEPAMIEDFKDLASKCFLMQMKHTWSPIFLNRDILHSYTCTETILSGNFIIEGCINCKSNADPVEDPQTDMAVLGAVLEKLNFFSDQIDWIGMNSDLALINW